MYIFIMEDGTIYHGNSVTEDDLSAVDDGILDIVNTGTKECYNDGGWHELEAWGA